MEFLSHYRRSQEVESSNEDYDDSMTGEVIDSGLTDDGRRLWYRLRMPNGTIEEYALPTKRLGVRFTCDGPIELDENH